MICNILSNKSVWKFIVLASYAPGAGYTRQEILKLLHWNNLSLDRTLKKLEFYGIIIKEGRIIRLNLESVETTLLLDVVEYEKKRLRQPSFELFMILNEFLRLIEGKDIKKAYLFGSHAKKTASVHSDIDIAIFSDATLDLIEAQDAILQEFNKRIEVHYFSAQEKGKLVDEVVKHGVLIL